ncbi:hypothetical protein L6R49_11490 [Myxococcota bacterium]|nr:hypothetical protein [Myxococcota bacterium]
MVSPSLIALLHRLFADHHDELAQALQRPDWAKGLMQKLQPHERTDPAPWFRELVQHVQLFKRQSALLYLLRDLHPAQLPDIDAVAAELRLHGTGILLASSPPSKGTKEGQAP